jgi:hypothetical protein
VQPGEERILAELTQQVREDCNRTFTANGPLAAWKQHRPGRIGEDRNYLIGDRQVMGAMSSTDPERSVRIATPQRSTAAVAKRLAAPTLPGR